jgi:hypothetical protein
MEKEREESCFFFCIAVLFSFVQPNSQASGGSSPWLNPFYGLSWVESIGVFDCGGFGVGFNPLASLEVHIHVERDISRLEFFLDAKCSLIVDCDRGGSLMANRTYNLPSMNSI